MSADSPKSLLFEQFARMAKALGHPHRLELLEALAQGERGVEGLARVTGLTVANASQHLQQMRRAGLVASRRQGVKVLYRLSGDDVIGLFNALQRAAERHLAEVDRVVDGVYRKRDGMEPISREDLLARVKEGTVTVVDVRPPEEFAAGHLPGALNLPLEELEARIAALPRDREVVAYCRGSWCVLSFDAVAALRRKGFSARRLADGYPEWRAEGLPIDGAVNDTVH